MTRYDHGHEVDESRQCSASTRFGRQCRNRALVGKPHCALHGGEAGEYNRRGVEALARANKRGADHAERRGGEDAR